MKILKLVFLLVVIAGFTESKAAAPKTAWVSVDSVQYQLNLTEKTGKVMGILKNRPVIKDTIVYDSMKIVINALSTKMDIPITGLDYIILPENIQIIEDDAFNLHHNFIQSIVLSENVNHIGRSAFDNCYGLKFINIPKQIKAIETGFYFTGLRTFTIPSNIETIGFMAFHACRNLTSVTIGRNVNKIDYKAFGWCDKLEEVYIYAQTPPIASSDAFDDSYPEYMTLHVLQGTKAVYEKTSVWNTFGTIVDDLVLPESLELDVESVKIGLGDYKQIKALVDGVDTDNENILWEVSDPEVAAVNEQGVVEGLSYGTAYVRATYGDLFQMCKVTVAVLAEEVKLDSSDLELMIGEQMYLNAEVSPDNTSDKTIKWTTSNPEVADVTQEGLVLANSVGSALITASCDNQSDTCTVVVKDLSGIEEISTDENAAFEVYNLSGILLKSCASESDLHNLASGVYIIVSNGKAYKVKI